MLTSKLWAFFLLKDFGIVFECFRIQQRLLGPLPCNFLKDIGLDATNSAKLSNLSWEFCTCWCQLKWDEPEFEMSSEWRLPKQKVFNVIKVCFFIGVAWPTKKIHGGSGHLVSMVIAKVWCVAPAPTTQSSPILHATGLAVMMNLGVDHGSVCQSLLVAGSSMVLWIIMVPSKLTVFGRVADGTLFLHNARCDFVHLSMRFMGFSCILILFWVSGPHVWTAQSDTSCWERQLLLRSECEDRTQTDAEQQLASGTCNINQY